MPMRCCGLWLENREESAVGSVRALRIIFFFSTCTCTWLGVERYSCPRCKISELIECFQSFPYLPT
eukprot:5723253-Prymnesium_polylepis.1